MIDFNKPLQTRDGRPVRILATDLKGIYPVAAVVPSGGEETVQSFTLDGRFYASADSEETEWDLRNVPEETVEYGNFYPDRGSATYAWCRYVEREAAREGKAPDGSGVTLKVTKVDGRITAVSLA
jgi:hypothetical protein